MQDKYAADVGDFGKYALLRYIQQNAPDHKLGVIWYKTDPKHTDGQHQTRDGKHIRYLGLAIDTKGKVSDEPRSKDGEDFEQCDKALYSELQKIVRKGRSLAAIEQSNILGESVTYFSDLVSITKQVKPRSKEQTRKAWLDCATKASEDCGIVFLDPDNGLSDDDKRSGRKADDAKYVFAHELDRLWGSKTRVLVLYHHPNRKNKNVSHDQQIANLVRRISNRGTFKQTAIFPLRYRRGTSRVFFVIVPERDGERWEKLLRNFVEKRPWPRSNKSGQAFELKFPLAQT